MNWDAIAAVGEIVGAAGVIASVVYLAIQVRRAIAESRAATFHKIFEGLAVHTNHMFGPENADLVARGFRSYVSLPGLSTVESRTLVVVGDRDPLIPLPLALEMYEAIPVAALWVIPAKGHSAMWPEWGGSAEMASILPTVVTQYLGTEPLESPAGR